jgi:hypothetical protein
MTHKRAIHDDQNLMVIVFSGEISAAEEMQAVREAVQDPRLKPNAKFLVDRREAKMTVTPDDVEPQIDLVKTSSAGRASRWSHRATTISP